MPELGPDRGLDLGGHAIRSPRSPEDDIAALEIGRHVLAADRFVDRPQAGHRDQVVAAHVDPTQE